MGGLVYVPSVIGVADAQYTNAKHGVATSQRHVFLVPLYDGRLRWTGRNLSL